MKKVIFIGSIGCGKTTLSQALTGKEISYKKTQSVEAVDRCILDTPGEFLELQNMRGALMITSAEAEIIALVYSAIDDLNMFSPAYGGSFAKEVIGIVTKIDIATPEQIEMAERILKNSGATKIFKISSYTKEGLEELQEYLKD